MEKQPASPHPFLNKVHRIIEDNLSDEFFSVEDLAEKLNLSRSMLHRKLVKLAGKSARELITEHRIERALDLLYHEDVTSTEVAYRVGFNDAGYFSKVFKKYYGISPSQVKNRDPEAIRELRLPGTPVERPGIKKLSRIRIIGWILLSLFVAYGIYYLIYKHQEPENSVAVLPLQNLTGNENNRYFVEGIHDALIGELGQVQSLRVISRTSTLKYRETDRLLEDIANELGVNIIIEGSVQSAGDSLKLLIQLIEVFPRERHLLVNEYHDKMENVLTVQRKAVKDIAGNIRIRLSKNEEELLSETRKVNPETYKDYLRGLYQFNQGTPESFEQGMYYMRKAIDRDPGDPLAYAGLALGYALKGHGMISPEGAFRSAAAAAERAIMIDPALDEAYTALALIYSYQLWDWPKVRAAFENALAKNPNNAIAHAHYAFYWVHFNAREKALYHAEMAIALEPLSAAYHSWLAWLYFYYGEDAKAEDMALQALALNEKIPYGNLVLGWIYVRRKEYQKAMELHEKLPQFGDYYKMLIGYTYINSGHREKAMELLNEMEEDARSKFVNPFHRGMLAGMLGYTDRAFELFNIACKKKYYPIIYIDIFPGIENLKKDPRYCELLQDLLLPCNQLTVTAQK